MRDNIKPVEAGFFKYCMKNLSHEGSCFEYWPFRENLSIRNIIYTYCEKYKVSKKVIHRIVNKWIDKGLARRNHLNFTVGFSFCFDTLPIEYIMLIPRRVLRKVPAFGLIMDTDRCKDYALVFVFKTRANGLENVDAIRESRKDYWDYPAFNIDKYNTALLNINKIVDGSIKYNGKLLISCTSYILDASNISKEIILKDTSLVNHTIRTLKKYVEFARTNRRAWEDAWKAKPGNFISEVDILIREIFENINCK